MDHEISVRRGRTRIRPTLQAGVERPDGRRRTRRVLRHACGVAYLLEWVQFPEGGWGAEIAWIGWNGLAWEGRRRKVTAEDLTRIEGQDYNRVPRRRAKFPR